MKRGVVLIDNHRTGVIIGENPGSPWHQATFYSQGSILRDLEGKPIREVSLFETIDPDGDMTWSVLWKQDGVKGAYYPVVGMGKWKGIAGEGKETGEVRSRADGHSMPKYELRWELDEANDDRIKSFAAKGDYTNNATSLSFHGPHVTESMRELANGFSLEISTQAGVLIGEDPNVPSPRSYATCYDRGTTIWSGKKRLADIMLLEDTDPDGDIAWLIHVWWYAKG